MKLNLPENKLITTIATSSIRLFVGPTIFNVFMFNCFCEIKGELQHIYRYRTRMAL